MATASHSDLPDLDHLPNAPGEPESADEFSGGHRRFLLFQAAPAWLISTLVHVIIIVVLALVTLTDPTKVVNVLSATAANEEGPEIEEFAIEELDPAEMTEEMEEMSEPVELTDPVEMVEPVNVEVPVEVAAVPLEMSDFATEMAPAASQLQSIASVQATAMGGRSADMKKKLLREYGGNAASEAAVTEALKWFALHQVPDGGWTFAHHHVCNGACGNPGEERRYPARLAATSLALLPFLGAGQTHYTGEFKDTVRAGLMFLINNGKRDQAGGLPVLDLSESAGNGMYSHGLAAIVLTEAYAMTEDPALAGPAQRALNYISAAQCSDGGWRYRPRQADGGDTSVVGWQVMALKSGHMGHLIVPPQTIAGSVRFLNKVQSNGGAWYGYSGPQTRMNASCTAVGLLCRMYTGWDKHRPEMKKGVKALAKAGVRKNDIYYDYYAAQVLRQYGGTEWEKFNKELRDWLVQSQSQSRGAKGSWFFKSKHVDTGGRLTITSFATMILEVYYRHMPLYAEQTEEDDFPL